MIGKAIIIALLAVIFGPLIWSLWNLDWNLHFHKHHPGKCRIIKRQQVGSEDFQILSSGLTFVTSGLIMGLAPEECKTYVKSKGKGSIQLVDMNNPNPHAKILTFKHNKDFDPATFRPHGLSVLEDRVKGEHLVYVINHAEGSIDRVEKFRFSPGTEELHHLKSIFSDLLLVTNDLTLVSEDKFYITNWMYFNSHHLNLLEQFYHIPFGGILYYNGTGMTTIKDRIFNPNSVLLSKDKRFVYMSLPMDKTVNVYQRKSDNNLELIQEVKVHSAVDNFHLSENGDGLYGGCHPIKHKSGKHMLNPSENKAPSQVLYLPLEDGFIVENEITLEFYDHGDLISGSSIAGVYKNRLLVGSVVDTLALCDLPAKS